MINVNQITAQLAKMPDAALQQYASLHKNDPYTVSLAMSESNRRKEMRASAQPQPGQQPTVVDQGIAGMGAQPAPQMPQGQAQAMPENTGIGTLPQPHMQKMAEGGIVAFADGGVNRADEEQRRAYAYEQYKRDSAERATADPLDLPEVRRGLVFVGEFDPWEYPLGFVIVRQGHRE